MYICVYLCVYMPCVHRYMWRAEKGVESPGARVSGSCKPLDMGAGN